MRYGDQEIFEAVMVEALCSLDCVLIHRRRGNATYFRQEPRAMVNAACFLSGTDYKNKLLSLCFGELPSAGYV